MQQGYGIIRIEKHQMVAIGIFLVTSIYFFSVNEHQLAMQKSVYLGASLIPIIFYRLIAWAMLSGWGFPEIFSRVSGSKNHPGPYAFFFWILFILAWLFLVFDWSLY